MEIIGTIIGADCISEGVNELGRESVEGFGC